MKIETRVTGESLYFSDYHSEILGPKYVSFRCYELIFTKVWLLHLNSSMEQPFTHFAASTKTTVVILLNIWNQTIWTMGLNINLKIQHIRKSGHALLTFRMV